MKLSPDDAAASSVPPLADEGPAAPSFPGTPGRRRPEESPMPQQTRDGHEPVQAAPDETARLAGGPASAPPPGTGAHDPSAPPPPAGAGGPPPPPPPTAGRRCRLPGRPRPSPCPPPRLTSRSTTPGPC